MSYLLCDVVYHGSVQAGVTLQPEGGGHDAVGIGQPVVAAVVLVGEVGLTGQIAAEELSGADAGGFQVAHEGGDTVGIGEGDGKAEPGWLADYLVAGA